MGGERGVKGAGMKQTRKIEKACEHPLCRKKATKTLLLPNAQMQLIEQQYCAKHATAVLVLARL